MSVELHRDSPVFERCVNVRQCQGTSESRTTPLDYRIIPGTRSIAGGSSGQSERLFHFEVSIEQPGNEIVLLLNPLCVISSHD